MTSNMNTNQVFYQFSKIKVKHRFILKQVCAVNFIFSKYVNKCVYVNVFNICAVENKTCIKYGWKFIYNVT